MPFGGYAEIAHAAGILHPKMYAWALEFHCA